MSVLHFVAQDLVRLDPGRFSNPVMLTAVPCVQHVGIAAFIHALHSLGVLRPLQFEDLPTCLHNSLNWLIN